MTIQAKRPVRIVPGYSLTGDLLSYLRCRMQYRYHNGSSLPPSRPVQMWFGEFIHGVMEGAYRIWLERKLPFDPAWPFTYRDDPMQPPPAREAHDIAVIGERVEARLKRQGKVPRSDDTRASAYRRANVGVNRIGKYLFPLIASAEEHLLGTRTIPPKPGTALRADRYELSGVIDVLTNVTLGGHSDNVIASAVEAVCPSLSGEYEVIVDYKGARRPALNEPYWEHGEWQVQTYAWLRGRQPKAKPVAAGILIYINELDPGSGDMSKLRKELAAGQTDVGPEKGSVDERVMALWARGLSPQDQLSEAFRLRRALRVIPVTETSIARATQAFDRVVQEIEICVADEARSGKIATAWKPSCQDAETCVACDFRNFCPLPAGEKTGYVPAAPQPF